MTIKVLGAEPNPEKFLTPLRSLKLSARLDLPLTIRPRGRPKKIEE